MKRAIIFDLDGTILDTLDDLMISTNTILKQYGMNPRSRQEIRSMIGHGIPHLVKAAIGTEVSEELYQSMLKDTLAHYLIHASDHTAPYPGILELLKQLRDEGYTLGVVSNKADEAVKDLCRTYFPDRFEAVIGQKPHVRKKPAPDTLNEAACLLNVSKREILYVGDSEVDIETSRNAGVEIVLVDWGFRDREELIQAGALDLVSDPQELYAYIKSKS